MRLIISVYSKSLSWSSHISKISTKASQTFNFLWRNLSKCLPPIKASEYFTVVCPIMEYAAIAWDPYQLNNINALEKSSVELPVGYGRYSSVSNLLHNLNWQPLQVCCKISRLQMFYKAVASTQLNRTIYSTTFPINKLSNQKLSSVSLYSPQYTNQLLSKLFIQELLKNGANSPPILLKRQTIYNHFHYF